MGTAATAVSRVLAPAASQLLALLDWVRMGMLLWHAALCTARGYNALHDAHPHLFAPHHLLFSR